MPSYYAQIDEKGRVFAVSELAGEIDSPDMIPIHESQYQNSQLLFTRYVKGEFQGWFARMEADETAITANGQDTMTVQITVTDWEGKVQKAFNEELVVELDGMRQKVKAAKGVAAITISSEEPGEFLLRTSGLDRNAELKVVIADAN